MSSSLMKDNEKQPKDQAEVNDLFSAVFDKPKIEQNASTLVRKEGELYKLLQDTRMEDIVSKVISRRDGLSHLLMSDVDQLLLEI